ncbi:MAG: hypothetical protein ACRCXZ_07105 [Patescibacteria group bacterium]
MNKTAFYAAILVGTLLLTVMIEKFLSLIMVVLTSQTAIIVFIGVILFYFAYQIALSIFQSRQKK